MEKILDIVDSLAHQKGLDIESVRNVLKQAMIRTAKKIIGDSFYFTAEIDNDNKKVQLYQNIEVVKDNDQRLINEEKESVVAISKAREIDPNLEIGDEIDYDISLEGFGRTAAMTLQYELDYGLQRLSENLIYDKYQAKIGTIISGTVTRVDEEENTYIEFDEIRAVLPKKNRIKGERFRTGNVVKSIVKKVMMNHKDGIKIELSRTTPKFLTELLALEVPEIGDGSVVIERAARIPGERAKVALYSVRSDVDAIGATVGVKGVRINSVSKELKNENIDVINYSEVPELFIARSMSPAIVNSVVCQDSKAIVTITSDQKAKAIGKNGINIRLAAMLTNCEIELQEIEQSAEDAQKQSNNEKNNSHSDADILSKLFKD